MLTHEQHSERSGTFAPPSADGVTDTPLTELTQLIQTGRIPNALLFSGAPGTGKKKTAYAFASQANCLAKGPTACGICTACKKIRSGMHPDMICVGLEDAKKNLTIAQIRDVGRLISVRPNEAAFRMVLIRDADRMNVQAQNALLKVLEEPPERTLFILTAEGTARLLPTILSRCRLFRFRPMSPGRLKETLVTGHGISPQTAHILAKTLPPDIRQALICAGKPPESDPEDQTPPGDRVTWQNLRTWLIGEVLDLIRGSGAAAAEKGLNLSRTLAARPDQLDDAMAILRTLLRDICVRRYDPSQIVNLDFFDAFADISGMYTYPTFLEWMTAFHDTEKRLGSNSGPRLTLDRFFLKLSLPKGRI
ncbi:MAG TPA: DNA polymerase III subunit delta' [Desulfobacteraceae bacterium]|mgnify:CR=1 FL=1|nr:DNA polymerase III subunit delta' [Desulfobacteraceae bacterium]